MPVPPETVNESAREPHDEPSAHDPPVDEVVILCGSTRTGSFNEQLARLLMARLQARGVRCRYVDLRDHPMPLLAGDVLDTDGPPASAHALHALLAAARAVVIVSPEYNGAMTPLLKNSVDWVSRVDIATFFTKPVVLAAATPGRRAGAAVLSLTTTWLRSIGADVHEATFGLGSVRHVLVDGVLLDGHDERLDAFADGVTTWLNELPS